MQDKREGQVRKNGYGRLFESHPLRKTILTGLFYLKQKQKQKTTKNCLSLESMGVSITRNGTDFQGKSSLTLRNDVTPHASKL